MRYLYHATYYSNLGSILLNGLKKSMDGYVYLTEQPNQAASFLAIRGVRKILIAKVKIYKKDECNIVETFDHSEKFFKFRCYGYKGDIDVTKIVSYSEYNL